ncbi:MAG TPA: DNA adenine methylase [Planctomycetota bacterium]|nr:DNA adenine methylase [Planctomycetota bacterium]HRR82667.1 DNA adenine methylase [Planctomycetota bacterium]HRT96762.1 DNA adenine methylase [Planctomycetota bacterium]
METDARSYDSGVLDDSSVTRTPLFRHAAQQRGAQKTPFASARNRLLERLWSDSRLSYKRYLGSPLRYAGGKSLAVGFVLERLPDRITRLVSPFLGGGSVEVACAVECGLPVIASDIFDILCNYWQVQLEYPEALYRRLAALEPTRETFAAVKRRLSDHWKGIQRLDRYDLAAHYYFNSNTSYGPHFLGWPSDVYLQEKRYRGMIEKVRAFRAPTMHVRTASFEEIIASYPTDFLYCDPPYYLDEGKTFCGMYPHRNFPIHHKGFPHEALREMLRSHRGGFVLSYNDCATIRSWYRDCEMTAPKWQYTFGQGDTRIGENRARSNNGTYVKLSHELLIWRMPA